MRKILIIDDNERICKSLTRNFTHAGFDCSSAYNGSEAMLMLDSFSPDAIILDLALRNESGIDILSQILQQNKHLPVIMITGYGTIETAVEAIKKGAYDYLRKPIEFPLLLFKVNRAIETSLHKKPAVAPQNPNQISKTAIFKSEEMNQVYQKATHFAENNFPLFIYGKPGTGKDMLADYIHQKSAQAAHEIVRIRNSTTPTHLQYELIGYDEIEKIDYVGIFEHAKGSTIYFSEIEFTSLNFQEFLYNVIKNGVFQKSTSNTSLPLECRIIISSNENPVTLLQNGKLSENLYNFIKASEIAIPQLVDRKEDIVPLLEYYASVYSIASISEEAQKLLVDYMWPGNVTELKNVMQSAAAQAGYGIVLKEHLPDVINNKLLFNTDNLSQLEAAEKRIILTTLKENKYNKKKTAEILNISRKTLYNKLEQYEIKLSDLP